MRRFSHCLPLNFCTARMEWTLLKRALMVSRILCGRQINQRRHNSSLSLVGLSIIHPRHCCLVGLHSVLLTLFSIVQFFTELDNFQDTIAGLYSIFSPQNCTKPFSRHNCQNYTLFKPQLQDHPRIKLSHATCGSPGPPGFKPFKSLQNYR